MYFQFPLIVQLFISKIFPFQLEKKVKHGLEIFRFFGLHKNKIVDILANL